MGCGSSNAAQALVLDKPLLSHLARMLQIPEDDPDIKQYAAALRSEGFNTPDDFNDLKSEELKEAPFNFRRQHLKKVARWRQGDASLSDADAQEHHRLKLRLGSSVGSAASAAWT